MLGFFQNEVIMMISSTHMFTLLARVDNTSTSSSMHGFCRPYQVTARLEVRCLSHGVEKDIDEHGTRVLRAPAPLTQITSSPDPSHHIDCIVLLLMLRSPVCAGRSLGQISPLHWPRLPQDITHPTGFCRPLLLRRPVQLF